MRSHAQPQQKGRQETQRNPRQAGPQAGTEGSQVAQLMAMAELANQSPQARETARLRERLAGSPPLANRSAPIQRVESMPIADSSGMEWSVDYRKAKGEESNRGKSYAVILPSGFDPELIPKIAKKLGVSKGQILKLALRLVWFLSHKNLC